MAEIAVLKKHIIHDSNTREVYFAYYKAGYSRQYFLEHEGVIILHKAAKKAFDELRVKKLPAIKSLDREYAVLLLEKKAAYVEYRAVREEVKELLVHKVNVDSIFNDHKDINVPLER